jgi:hypothetical protein
MVLQTWLLPLPVRPPRKRKVVRTRQLETASRPAWTPRFETRRNARDEAVVPDERRCAAPQSMRSGNFRSWINMTEMCASSAHGARLPRAFRHFSGTRSIAPTGGFELLLRKMRLYLTCANRSKTANL